MVDLLGQHRQQRFDHLQPFDRIRQHRPRRQPPRRHHRGPLEEPEQRGEQSRADRGFVERGGIRLGPQMHEVPTERPQHVVVAVEDLPLPTEIQQRVRLSDRPGHILHRATEESRSLVGDPFGEFPCGCRCSAVQRDDRPPTQRIHRRTQTVPRSRETRRGPDDQRARRDSLRDPEFLPRPRRHRRRRTFRGAIPHRGRMPRRKQCLGDRGTHRTGAEHGHRSVLACHETPIMGLRRATTAKFSIGRVSVRGRAATSTHFCRELPTPR